MEKEREVNRVHHKRPEDIPIRHMTRRIVLLVHVRLVVDKAADHHLGQLKHRHRHLHPFRDAILHRTESVVRVHHG